MHAHTHHASMRMRIHTASVPLKHADYSYSLLSTYLWMILLGKKTIYIIQNLIQDLINLFIQYSLKGCHRRSSSSRSRHILYVEFILQVENRRSLWLAFDSYPLLGSHKERGDYDWWPYVSLSCRLDWKLFYSVSYRYRVNRNLVTICYHTIII